MTHAYVSICVVNRAEASRHIDNAVTRFLSTIEDLNHEINGPIPSELGRPSYDSLPRDIVYAVCEVLRALHCYVDQQLGTPSAEAARLLAWRAEKAWSAVLDGDIDDIRLHLEHEEAALAH